jgi:hypothetical protein
MTGVDHQTEQALRSWARPHSAELDVADISTGFSASTDMAGGHCLQPRTVVEQHGVPQLLCQHGVDLPGEVKSGVDSGGQLANLFHNARQFLGIDCGHSRRCWIGDRAHRTGHDGGEKARPEPVLLI